MKTEISLTLLICCSLLTACQKDPTNLGKETAREILKEALADSSYVLLHGDTVIKNKDTAITIAEAALFPIYGEANIKSEQPYEAYLIDGYWVISGTLPKGWKGGTFEVIINAMDGRFVYLSHGK